MIAPFTQTDFTSQTAAQYKANIDACIALLGDTASDFSCHENNPQAMNIVILGGAVLWGSQVVKFGGQTTSTITAPGSNSRIDRVVLDPVTGVASVVTGVSSASPVAPAMPFNKVPLCQVLLTSVSTVISNSMITDDRSFITLAPKVSRRQCAQTGVVDSAGRAAFLSAGTGLTGTVLATAKPLVLAYGLGYGGGGDIDLAVQISADAASAIAVAANNINYDYADYLTPTTVTWASTLNPPQWGDAYDRTKQCLLHFDGTNGATTTLDDYGNTVTLTSATLTTTNPKFGSACLAGGAAKYAEISGLEGKAFPPTGWTIQFWATQAGAQPANARLLCFNQTANTNDGVQVYTTGATNLTAAIQGNTAAIAGTFTLPASGTWFHVALCYDALGGKLYLYAGGISLGNATVTGASFGNINQAYINALGGSLTTFNWNGNTDEFEFVPFCRYPAGTTFTPPAAAGTVGGDFFSTADAKMYTVSGASVVVNTDPVLTQVARVYLGEQDTSGAAVTATRTYAYRGIYTGTLTTPLPGTTTQTTINHNVGVRPTKVELILENIIAEQSYKPGDQLRDPNTSNATYVVPIPKRTTANSMSFSTQQTTAWLSTPAIGGANVGLTAANWGYRVNVDRGF